MTCELCNEPKLTAEYTWRPCSTCNRPQAVCWLCGDGKDSGAVRFDHGCDRQPQLEVRR